jgi:hypothetical protein
VRVAKSYVESLRCAYVESSSRTGTSVVIMVLKCGLCSLCARVCGNSLAFEHISVTRVMLYLCGPS